MFALIYDVEADAGQLQLWDSKHRQRQCRASAVIRSAGLVKRQVSEKVPKRWINDVVCNL
jgi:hypothetical protein